MHWLGVITVRSDRLARLSEKYEYCPINLLFTIHKQRNIGWLCLYLDYYVTHFGISSPPTPRDHCHTLGRLRNSVGGRSLDAGPLKP